MTTNDRDIHDLEVVSLGSDPKPLHVRALATASCLLVVLGGLGAVVKQGGDEVDGEAHLAAARAAVAEVSSYSYELRRTSTIETGDPDGAGSEVTNRTLTTGTVAAADRWHVVDDSGDAYFGVLGEPYELVRIGSDVFEKGGYDDAPEGVDAPAWIESPVGEPMTVADYVEMYSFATDDAALDGFIEEFAEEDEAFANQWRLDIVLGAFLLPVETDPAHLHRLVEAAQDPVVEEQLAGGGTRLRTTLAPIDALAEASGEDVEPVDLVLDLDRDDLPTAARFSIAADGALSTVEVRFADWGADLDVQPPDPSDVDQTPWIMEEALAAIDDELLVAPTDLPEGLALSGADVYEWDEGCYELDLTYSDERESTFSAAMSEEEYEQLWAEIPWLSITVLTRDCSDDIDDTAFPSTFAGLPSRGDGEYLEVVVGDAVVTIDNDLTESELEALVGSLRVTTPASLAESIPAWARMWASQGWMMMGGEAAMVSDPT